MPKLYTVYSKYSSGNIKTIKCTLCGKTGYYKDWEPSLYDVSLRKHLVEEQI